MFPFAALPPQSRIVSPAPVATVVGRVTSVTQTGGPETFYTLQVGRVQWTVAYLWPRQATQAPEPWLPARYIPPTIGVGNRVKATGMITGLDHLRATWMSVLQFPAPTPVSSGYRR